MDNTLSGLAQQQYVKTILTEATMLFKEKHGCYPTLNEFIEIANTLQEYITDGLNQELGLLQEGYNVRFSLPLIEKIDNREIHSHDISDIAKTISIHYTVINEGAAEAIGDLFKIIFKTGAEEVARTLPKEAQELLLKQQAAEAAAAARKAAGEGTAGRIGAGAEPIPTPAPGPRPNYDPTHPEHDPWLDPDTPGPRPGPGFPETEPPPETIPFPGPRPEEPPTGPKPEEPPTEKQPPAEEEIPDEVTVPGGKPGEEDLPGTGTPSPRPDTTPGQPGPRPDTTPGQPGPRPDTTPGQPSPRPRPRPSPDTPQQQPGPDVNPRRKPNPDELVNPLQDPRLAPRFWPFPLPFPLPWASPNANRNPNPTPASPNPDPVPDPVPNPIPNPIPIPRQPQLPRWPRGGDQTPVSRIDPFDDDVGVGYAPGERYGALQRSAAYDPFLRRFMTRTVTLSEAANCVTVPLHEIYQKTLLDKLKAKGSSHGKMD